MHYRVAFSLAAFHLALSSFALWCALSTGGNWVDWSIGIFNAVMAGVWFEDGVPDWRQSRGAPYEID